MGRSCPRVAPDLHLHRDRPSPRPARRLPGQHPGAGRRTPPRGPGVLRRRPGGGRRGQRPPPRGPGVPVDRALPGAARNLLVDEARGDLLLLPRRRRHPASPTLLALLAELADAHPDAGVFGGPNDTPPGSSRFEVVQGAAMASIVGSGPVRRRYGPHPAGPADERFFILCNLAVRRAAMVPFDPDLVCAEENAVLSEMSRSGVAMYYDPRWSPTTSVGRRPGVRPADVQVRPRSGPADPTRAPTVRPAYLVPSLMLALRRGRPRPRGRPSTRWPSSPWPSTPPGWPRRPPAIALTLRSLRDLPWPPPCSSCSTSATAPGCSAGLLLASTPPTASPRCWPRSTTGQAPSTDVRRVSDHRRPHRGPLGRLPDPNPARAGGAATPTPGRCGTSTSRSSPAQVLGVIGGNGSGKTTLLQVLAGVIPPTRGEVTSAGGSLARRPLRRVPPRPHRPREPPDRRRAPRPRTGRGPQPGPRRSSPSAGSPEESLDWPLAAYSAGMGLRLGFSLVVTLAARRAAGRRGPGRGRRRVPAPVRRAGRGAAGRRHAR